MVNSYNRRVLLEEAIRSLYEKLEPPPKDVLIVDDGSTDGSLEWIEGAIASNRYPGLRLLRPAERVLFAGGVNLGILSTTAPYVCLFETDNLALDSGIWKAVSYLEANPKVAGVGFRVVTREGKPAGNSMSFPHPLAFVLGQQLAGALGLEDPSAGPHREVVFTSPLVVSRRALARTGLMDAGRFPFCDCDVEWARRIADAGFELHVLEDVACVHDQGGVRSEFSKYRTLDFHRARLSYFRIYHPRRTPFIRLGLLLRHLGELAALSVLCAAGKVGADRVRMRVELLRRWPRSYR